jgi:hypothetical protein
MASVRDMMAGSIPARGGKVNGRVSRETASPTQVLAMEWASLPSLAKRDKLNAAMKEEGFPCPISFAMSDTAQMKPISYRMNEEEKLAVLSDKAWPDTVSDVMNLEAFQDTTTDEIRAMRLKMGTVTLSGDEVFGILAGKEEDISIASQSKGKPGHAFDKQREDTLNRMMTVKEENEKPDGLIRQWVNGKEYWVKPDEDEDSDTSGGYVKPVRKKDEGFGEYMKRCKAAKADAEKAALAVASGKVPNSGSVREMASTAAVIKGSNALRESIADAGGILPTETRASRAGKQAMQKAGTPSRAEIIARLLAEEEADTLSDAQVAAIEGIVRKEIARAFARFLSLFPADYLPTEEDEE